MTTILHGEDTVKSRQELDNLKRQAGGLELINLSGSQLNLTELKQALESQSLFGQEKLVILENLLGRKKDKEQGKIVDYLKAEEPKTGLILWEDREISRTVLRSFSKATLKIFKLDPLLFRFLEALKPGENLKMIEAFRQAQTQDEVNLLFYMLIRQFRLLLFLRTGEKAGLEELDRMADWQKARLNKQAQYFTLEKLRQIYRQFLETDYREKSGLASYSLAQTLELFLATL
ncbi:MAG: hypothetical protein Q8P89_04585 [bacterium]|nr:hypothetical protein [bacterium]